MRPARVVDANRVLGPIPYDHVTSVDATAVVAELDHLGITTATVTPSAALFGDPQGITASTNADVPERLTFAPVVVPGHPGVSTPSSVTDLIDSRPVMVRACPVRHRFDVLGPTAMRWWRSLAEAAVPVAIDVSETGLPAVADLARAIPRLRLLALAPGYRLLRPLSELLHECRDVWIESGTIVAAGAIEWLARTHGAHRLVFGTGAPLWDDAGPRFQLDHLDLPDTDVELIASGSFALLTEGLSG